MILLAITAVMSQLVLRFVIHIGMELTVANIVSNVMIHLSIIPVTNTLVSNSVI